MINVDVIITILLAHFIADFTLQSDWMAKNKSSDNLALSYHVLAYTTALGAFMVAAVVLFVGKPAHGYEIVVLWAAANGALHWITDYITSRINKALWESGNTHNFFVGIGFDQYIHYMTLVLTAKWMIV